MTMKKEPTFHVLKGGHSIGTWKGDPVKAPAKSKGEVYQVTEEEVQTNEEEPLMPPVLTDVTPDVAGSVTAKKKTEAEDDEDKLMPIII